MPRSGAEDKIVPDMLATTRTVQAATGNAGVRVWSWRGLGTPVYGRGDRLASNADDSSSAQSLRSSPRRLVSRSFPLHESGLWRQTLETGVGRPPCVVPYPSPVRVRIYSDTRTRGRVQREGRFSEARRHRDITVLRIQFTVSTLQRPDH